MGMDSILRYLAALEENNTREWYHANKDIYESANRDFEDLIQQLIIEIGKTDDLVLRYRPKELTFKLVRDTRFSHDKSPYNPCFRAHIASGGKLPIPVGCYIMIRPGNRSFLGGGLFADMFKDATDRVRNHIAGHSSEWAQLLASNDFSKHFTVQGSALKNMPKGFDENHPQAAFLKQKSWYLEYPVSDEQLQSSTFISFASEIFRAMQPFNTFLNSALEGFVMPSRQ
jgi:uncharacterized protein (TIGR02453 family)